MSYEFCSSRHCNVCIALNNKPVQERNNKALLPAALKLSNITVRKCNGCHLVSYCTPEHQRHDWPLHRELCNAVQKIIATYKLKHPFLINGQPTNKREMEIAILKVKFLLRTALGRPLSYHEEEFTSFPVYCAVCFDLRALKNCGQCEATSYCSAEHANEDASFHRIVCGYLQVYYCPYKVVAYTSGYNASKDNYRPIASLKNLDLFEVFQQFTSKQLSFKPNSSLAAYQQMSNAADFSCVATICYALEFVDMATYTNKKFIVFVVGASVEQELWFREQHVRFFFLQHPKITHLELYFFGPEILRERNSTSTFYFQGVQRTVHYKVHRCLFHLFTNKMNIKPSLIVSYNCGFSEYTHFHTEVKVQNSKAAHKTAPTDAAGEPEADSVQKDTWSRGILDMLAMYSVPIVFTSFTKMEAEFDYGALMQVAQTDKLLIKVERFINLHKNPYRDLRPLRKWSFHDNEEFYFRNGYLQGVHTSVRNYI